jgi:hypothetical protein
MHIDALRRDADLAGMVVATLDQRLDDPLEIGAAVDDRRCRPAVLQRRARAMRQLGMQIPADLGRADEAEEGDALVGDQLFGELVGLRQEGLAPGFRQAGLMHQRDEVAAAQGRRARRLDDDRAADRDRRRDLVDDQVERVVEGRDRRDDADRLLGGEGPAPHGRRRQPHRDLATGEVPEFVGGVVDPVDGARRLDDRVGQRLAAFARDLPGEMVALGRQQLGELAQDRDPLMGFEPAIAIAEDLLGRLQFGFERRGIVGGDLLDRRAIISLDHCQHLGLLGDFRITSPGRPGRPEGDPGPIPEPLLKRLGNGSRISASLRPG